MSNSIYILSISIFLYGLLSFSQSLDSLRLVLPVGHKESIHVSDFSSDCKRILTTSSDNTVKVWDANSGKLQLDLSDLNTGSNGFFSPNDSSIITFADNNPIHIFDAFSGNLIFQIQDGNSPKYSPNGQFIFSIKNNAIFICKAENGDFI